MPGLEARIWIVEDYPPNSVVRDLLEVNGFAVWEASTAEADGGGAGGRP